VSAFSLPQVKAQLQAAMVSLPFSLLFLLVKVVLSLSLEEFTSLALHKYFS